MEHPKTADVRDIPLIKAAAASIMHNPSPIFDKRFDEWLSIFTAPLRSAGSFILPKASDCQQFIEMTQDKENGGVIEKGDVGVDGSIILN
jgi:hypothetical protein